MDYSNINLLPEWLKGFRILVEKPNGSAIFNSNHDSISILSFNDMELAEGIEITIKESNYIVTGIRFFMSEGQTKNPGKWLFQITIDVEEPEG